MYRDRARMGFVLMLVFVIVAAGCGTTAKTRHLETHWDEGPDGELREVKVEITAKTRAGVFGSVPEGVHNVNAKWSAEEDTVQLGQIVSLDNTAQVQALEAAMPFVRAIIESAFTALSVRSAPQDGAQGAFSSGQVSELNRLFRSLGGRLDALGAELKAVKAQE